jgi:hypothetical protein
MHCGVLPRGNSSRYPLDRRLGGTQSRSGHGGGEKNSQPLLGIELCNPDRPVRSVVAIPSELSRVFIPVLNGNLSERKRNILISSDFGIKCVHSNNKYSRYTRVYPKVSGLSHNEICVYNNKHSLRSNARGYGCRTHQTDSQNSERTAPSG